MFDAVALLTELAQKVKDEREAEEKAYFALMNCDPHSSKSKTLGEDFDHAARKVARAERHLASMAIKLLLNQSI